LEKKEMPKESRTYYSPSFSWQDVLADSVNAGPAVLIAPTMITDFAESEDKMTTPVEYAPSESLGETMLSGAKKVGATVGSAVLAAPSRLGKTYQYVTGGSGGAGEGVAPSSSIIKEAAAANMGRGGKVDVGELAETLKSASQILGYASRLKSAVTDPKQWRSVAAIQSALGRGRAERAGAGTGGELGGGGITATRGAATDIVAPTYERAVRYKGQNQDVSAESEVTSLPRPMSELSDTKGRIKMSLPSRR